MQHSIKEDTLHETADAVPHCRILLTLFRTRSCAFLIELPTGIGA